MATYDQLIDRIDINGKHNVTVAEIMNSKDDMNTEMGDVRPDALFALFGSGKYPGRYMVCDSTDVNMHQGAPRFALRDAAEAYAKLTTKDCLDTVTNTWTV